jgi:membrane-associated phospholipid phosphatase
MSRGIGGVEGLQELLPEWIALVAAALTQFGDIWFLGLLLVVLYWSGRWQSDDIVLLGGTLLTGVGIYRTLKLVFALPRPDGPPLDPELAPSLLRGLYEAVVTLQSYGFPSGHATNAAAVYLGLAAVLTVGRRRWRFAVAGGLVALVSLTRVILGLHYLVDVTVGGLLGASLVAVAIRARRLIDGDRATPVLIAAVGVGILHLVASSGTVQSYALLGAELGLLGGWQLVVLAGGGAAENPPEPDSVGRRRAVAVLAIALLVVAPAGIVRGEPYYATSLAGVAAAASVVVPVAGRSGGLGRVLAAMGL